MNKQIVAKRRGQRVILWRGLLVAIGVRLLLVVSVSILSWRIFDGHWLSPIATASLIGAVALVFTTVMLLSARQVPLDGLPELPDDADHNTKS